MYPTGAKKNELCPWREQQGCIPAEAASQAFVTNMEDVLDLYARPEDPRRPVVCVDETSKQHLQEMRPPLPVMPGKPYRYDPEYKRNGVSNLFMISHPFSDFDTLKSQTNAEALISHISAKISWMCIFQTQKRY